MESRRGKRVAVAAGVAAAAVIAVAALAAKDRLLEEWHLRKLAAGSPWDREAALRWLGEKGSSRAVPEIREALREDIEGNSSAYSKRIARIGPIAVPYLAEFLKDRQFPVRLSAITALIALDPDADGRRAALRAALRDPHPAICMWAADALFPPGGPPDLGGIRVLAECLEGPDRDRAARKLGEIGPPAREALPALKEALASVDPEPRFYSGGWPTSSDILAEAIVEIGGPPGPDPPVPHFPAPAIAIEELSKEDRP